MTVFRAATLRTFYAGAKELKGVAVYLDQGCGSGYFSNASASTNKKRPLTIFFNFCGSVACLLLHFIILRRQKPSFIAITLPTSLELIVSNYSVFVFLRYQNLC